MNSLRLKDMCLKVGSGATPRGGKDVYLKAGDTALIRSQNVHNNRFEITGLAYITREHADQLKNVEVHTNDVLLNITGDSVARVCQVPADVIPARVNQHVAIIRPDSRHLDPKFLRFYLSSPRMQEEMLTLAAGGATRKALTKGMIEGFQVPALSIQSQRDIARLLGVLEDQIDLNLRMNEVLDAMAQAVFKDWFIDFGPTRTKAKGHTPYLAPELWELFPSALDDTGRPVGWETTLLGERVEILDFKRIPLSSQERRRRQGPYPYHGATGVMDYVDGFLFEGIHILLGEDGSVTKPNGKPFTQYVWGEFWVNNHAHVLKGNGIPDEMLLCFLQQLDIAPYVTGAVQPKLNQKNLKSIPFSASGFDTPAAFERVVGPLFQKFRSNAEQSLTLARIRDLLLPKLMSGEVCLRDAEVAVEAVA